MKSSLSHLPKTNQEQIIQIVQIIKELIALKKSFYLEAYAKGKQKEHKYQVKDGTTL